MYLDCKVEIPNEPGKITRFRKGNTTYIRYVAGRVYNPEKRYNVPDHKTIGKLVSEDPLLMIPNENFLRYFGDAELSEIIKRYKDRTGRYPERILADKIYRNRINLQYCKEHGIRLSGPSLGRPKKDQSADKKLEYIDNADRVAVERAFSLAKRAYSMGLIRTKLDRTTKSSIALSILAMNIDHLTVVSLCQYMIMIFSRFDLHFRDDLEAAYIL